MDKKQKAQEGGNKAMGQCPICNKKGLPLLKKVLKFDNIKCDCHAPSCHIEETIHCENCKPKEPTYTQMIISVKELKKLNEAYRLVKDKPPFNQ